MIEWMDNPMIRGHGRMGWRLINVPFTVHVLSCACVHKIQVKFDGNSNSNCLSICVFRSLRDRVNPNQPPFGTQVVLAGQAPDICIIMCMFCGDSYNVGSLIAPLFTLPAAQQTDDRAISLLTFLGDRRRCVQVNINPQKDLYTLILMTPLMNVNYQTKQSSWHEIRFHQGQRFEIEFNDLPLMLRFMTVLLLIPQHCSWNIVNMGSSNGILFWLCGHSPVTKLNVPYLFIGAGSWSFSATTHHVLNQLKNIHDITCTHVYLCMYDVVMIIIILLFMWS